MTDTEAKKRIENYLLTAWNLQYPTNIIDFDNIVSVDVNQLKGKMYLQSEIVFDSSNQSAMVGNSSPYRVGGNLFFHIYTSAGKGTIEAMSVKDFLITLFNLKDISGIIFRTIREVSSSKASVVDLHRLSCAAPFTFDSFTP